jgi:hypothetical protein
MPDIGIFRRPLEHDDADGQGQQSSVLILVLVEKRPAPFWGNRAGCGWVVACRFFFLFVDRQIGISADKEKERRQRGGGRANRPAWTAQIGETSRLFEGVSFGGLLTDWRGDGHGKLQLTKSEKVWCARPRKKKEG